MGSEARYFHPAGARRTLVEGPFSAVLLMGSGASGGKLSLVEHPLAPRALGSPMHTHAREDEYSYILAGQIGAQVGDEVIVAGPGEVIAKPAGIPHAFWNAGDEPARVALAAEVLAAARMLTLSEAGNLARPFLGVNQIRGVAKWCWMWFNRELSCNDYCSLWPGVAGRRWSLAPHLAPREPVRVAHVGTTGTAWAGRLVQSAGF